MLQVVWDPYWEHRADHPFNEVAFYTGCLKCMDIVEPYHPDQVLRQFGRVQRIPPTPLAPQRATRGATANQYRIAYNYLDQIWERRHNHLLSLMERGQPAAHPWDCAPNYMEWFLRVSHPIIQNLVHRSTFNPRVEESQGSSSIDPRLVWCLTTKLLYYV